MRAVRYVRGTVHHNNRINTHNTASARRRPTEGKEPPAATGLIVSRSHCEGGKKREGGTYRVSKEKKRYKGKTLTSSALETQRGSSTPISHWCSAAIVNLASRCALGTQVSS